MTIINEIKTKLLLMEHTVIKQYLTIRSPDTLLPRAQVA